jgi:hypothetical protein
MEFASYIPTERIRADSMIEPSIAKYNFCLLEHPGLGWLWCMWRVHWSPQSEVDPSRPWVRGLSEEQKIG